MITKYILQQYAASQKLSLATQRDIDKATARYINFQSQFN